MNLNFSRQIYFILILLSFLYMTAFSQGKIEKEFLVFSGKNAVITTEPEQSSIELKCIKSGLAELDTAEIIGRNEKYFKVAFISDENDYKLGWILQSDIENTFKVNNVYHLNRSGEGVEGETEDYKPHMDWGALENSIIRDGGILNGMNKSMITASLGEPDETNKYYTSDLEIEQWTYNKLPRGSFVLTFEGDKFNSITGYTEPLNVKFQKKLAKKNKYPYRTKGVELMAFGGATVILTVAFLRDDDTGNSILFSEKHKAFSWVVVSTFAVAEITGLYLYLYKDKKNEVSVKPGGNGFNLTFAHHF